MIPLTILLLAIGVYHTHAMRSYYTAAVFEHTGSELSQAPTEIKVKMNLELYKRAAKIAHSKGVDIIVFPEYGVLPFNDRIHIRPFLENIPNPEKIETTPCSRPDLFTNRPILYTLSCIAQSNSMYVVANMIDIQNCTGYPDCPDGAYHFNTNVVFDRRGTLLVKYHKEHPFFEQGIDVPKGKQVPIFKTDFGTFATYICFDLIFKRITEIAQLPSVDGVALSTNWVNFAPQYVSIEYFEAWAMGNNVTFLAANRQLPFSGILGSGIFDGKNGALAYTNNPDCFSKLVVAKVARSGAPKISPDASTTVITENAAWEWTEDSKNVSKDCPKVKGYSSMPEPMLPMYKFLKLHISSGDVEACNNGLCCKLSYTSGGLKENYYLGVYKGISNLVNKYFICEEVCLLVRCEDQNGFRCSEFPANSTTKFHKLFLRGNFTSDFVYPTVLKTGSKLVSTKYWKQNDDKSIVSKNSAGINYTTVGLKGRCYNKDPSYGS